jgi:hypothetical protein
MTPERGGGGVTTAEAIRIGLFVEAFEASKPSGPTTESWPHRPSKTWRARGRGVVAAVDRLVTGEGEPGEGRG